MSSPRGYDAACPTDVSSCDQAVNLLLDRRRPTFDPLAGAARLAEACTREASRPPQEAGKLPNCARLVTLSGKRKDIPALPVLRARFALCSLEDSVGSREGVCATLGDALRAAGQAGWSPPISHGVAERCMTKDLAICAVAGDVAMQVEPERALQLLTHGCVEGDAPACARFALWWTQGPGSLTGEAENAATKLREACRAGVSAACAASLRFEAGGLTSGAALLDKPELFLAADSVCAGGDPQACAALAFARIESGQDGQPDWDRACAAGCTDACDPGNDANTCFETARHAPQAEVSGRGIVPVDLPPIPE